MWKQIAVSTKAMPLYVLMPTVSELMIERVWTRCYAVLCPPSKSLVHIKAEPRAPIDSPFRETTTEAFQARAVASSHTRYRCGRFRSG